MDPDEQKACDYADGAIRDIKRQESEIPCWQLARKLTDEKHDDESSFFLFKGPQCDRKRTVIFMKR